MDDDVIQEKKSNQNDGGITVKKTKIFAQKMGRALLLNVFIGYLLVGMLGLWFSKIAANGKPISIYEKLSGFADIWGKAVPPIQQSSFFLPRWQWLSPPYPQTFVGFFTQIVNAVLQSNQQIQTQVFGFLRENCSEPVILFLSAWLFPLYLVLIFLINIPLVCWYPTQFVRAFLTSPTGLNATHAIYLAIGLVFFFLLGGVILVPLGITAVYLTQNMFAKSPTFGSFFLGNLSSHALYFLLIISWYLYHNSALYLGTQASYACLLAILLAMYFIRKA